MPPPPVRNVVAALLGGKRGCSFPPPIRRIVDGSGTTNHHTSPPLFSLLAEELFHCIVAACSPRCSCCLPVYCLWGLTSRQSGPVLLGVGVGVGVETPARPSPLPPFHPPSPGLGLPRRRIGSSLTGLCHLPPPWPHSPASSSACPDTEATIRVHLSTVAAGDHPFSAPAVATGPCLARPHFPFEHSRCSFPYYLLLCSYV